MSAMKWASLFKFTRKSICLYGGEETDIKIAEKESPNKGLTTNFRTLQLVERLLFMTESVQIGLLALS